MNTRQPTSKLEKFYEGLRIIKQHQPAASLAAAEGKLFVGNTEDVHISPGAREYLKGLGFTEDKDRMMFVFSTQKNER